MSSPWHLDVVCRVERQQVRAYRITQGTMQGRIYPTHGGGGERPVHGLGLGLLDDLLLAASTRLGQALGNRLCLCLGSLLSSPGLRFGLLLGPLLEVTWLLRRASLLEEPRIVRADDVSIEALQWRHAQARRQVVRDVALVACQRCRTQAAVREARQPHVAQVLAERDLVLVAAYTLDFLCVHPFGDGNG